MAIIKCTAKWHQAAKPPVRVAQKVVSASVLAGASLCATQGHTVEDRIAI